MKKYLLDTNICIYFLKGLYNLDRKIEKAEADNCFVSEITIAELKFGVENSGNREKNKRIVDDFVSKFTIIPIFNSLDIYAREKASRSRLKEFLFFEVLLSLVRKYQGN